MSRLPDSFWGLRVASWKGSHKNQKDFLMELLKGGTWLCATLVYTQLLVQFWDKSLSSAEFFTSITNMEQLDFEKFDESPRIKGLLRTGNSFATRAYFVGTL